MGLGLAVRIDPLTCFPEMGPVLKNHTSTCLSCEQATSLSAEAELPEFCLQEKGGLVPQRLNPQY